MAVVEKPWEGSSNRFSDEEWQRSCVLDRKYCGNEWTSKPPKSRCSMPIREPNGDLNRSAVQDAASRFNQTEGSAESMTRAKTMLRSAYREMGEDVPDVLKEDSSKSDELEGLSRQYGVEPGIARHGESAMRFQTGEADDTVVREEEASGQEQGYIGTLTGHFAVFDRWTEIDSFFEGRFMESLVPGAFSKTFEENRSNMRCLLQHGRDPQVGMKPLGPIRELEEDEVGARYEVPLHDTSINRDLIPALKDGLYGASFRFQVIREEVNSDPGRSDFNPEGIEERRITEAKVREFGPVTFPAYADATAGVRSLNDWWLDLDLEMFARAHPDAYPMRLAQLLTNLRTVDRTNGSEVENRTSEEGTETAAPSTGAPEPDRKARKSTHLPGAARTLRTSRNLEVPKWKL